MINMCIKLGKCTRCQHKKMVRSVMTKSYGYCWLCHDCLNYMEYGNNDETIVFSSQPKYQKEN